MDSISKGCCSIPPVISINYEPKGQYIDLEGIKTYVTGPSSASIAILAIHDIFGYFPQILQGADIIASAGFQVYMPSFFGDNPCNIEWYPPDNEEKMKQIGTWFTSTAVPDVHLPRIPGIIESIKKHNPAITTFGAIGYCWGGKLVTLLSSSADANQQTPFAAVAQVHPYAVNPIDALNISIPFCTLGSEEEDAKVVEEFMTNVKNQSKVWKMFPDQKHGFMSARGNLEDDNVKVQYQKAYQIVVDFFKENLIG